MVGRCGEYEQHRKKSVPQRQGCFLVRRSRVRRLLAEKNWKRSFTIVDDTVGYAAVLPTRQIGIGEFLVALSAVAVYETVAYARSTFCVVGVAQAHSLSCLLLLAAYLSFWGASGIAAVVLRRGKPRLALFFMVSFVLPFLFTPISFLIGVFFGGLVPMPDTFQVFVGILNP
jgi:hypothetical protein